jgi:hypothetical protein
MELKEIIMNWDSSNEIITNDSSMWIKRLLRQKFEVCHTTKHIYIKRGNHNKMNIYTWLMLITILKVYI